MKLKKAWEIIAEVCKEDKEYAWTVHCSLAVSIQDEGVDWLKANLAASRIMGILFGASTEKIVQTYLGKEKNS